MLRRMGRLNILCLAGLVLTLLLWIRSTVAQDRFIHARKPTSESWIPTAERYPWLGKAPKVLSNIEYHELGLASGRLWFARACWAERDESPPDYDPYTAQTNAPTSTTPWGAPNSPGLYHLRSDTRWTRGPIGATHLGWSYGHESGRTFYSGFPAQTWINDITELGIPLWSLAALFAIPPFARVIRKHLNRRHAPGTCAACGYDLRASNDRCPECGSEILLGKQN